MRATVRSPPGGLGIARQAPATSHQQLEERSTERPKPSNAHTVVVKPGHEEQHCYKTKEQVRRWVMVHPGPVLLRQLF
jgi:hypothetical protein